MNGRTVGRRTGVTAGARTGRAIGRVPALRAAGATEMPTGIRHPAPGVSVPSARPPRARNRQRA
eukprot:6249586-Alexandrium_andersonii.AAC.1